MNGFSILASDGNKMKNEKFHSVRTVLKCNRTIVDIGELDTPNTRIYNRSLSWLARGTSIVEQKLLTLPKHRSSPPVVGMVRVTRSLVLCV